MGKQKDTPGTSSEDRITKLENSVALLASSVGVMGSSLDNVLAAIGVRQHVPAGPARFEPEASQPRSTRSAGDWNEEEYYVRIKPYNPKRGLVRKRTLVPEIGRPINGGTGDVGDVPEWVRVRVDKAKALTRYRQNDADPDSPAVFDIATFAEMEEVNNREDQQRMAGLGMSGVTPMEVLRQAEQGKLKAKIGRDKPATRDRPSAVEGSDRFASAQSGRRAALDGLAAPVPPPPPAPEIEDAGDVEDIDDVNTPAPPQMHKNPQAEDLSVEAARGASIDEDIARIEMQTTGRSRMAPK